MSGAKRGACFNVKEFELHVYKGSLKALWKICITKKLSVDFSPAPKPSYFILSSVHTSEVPPYSRVSQDPKIRSIALFLWLRKAWTGLCLQALVAACAEWVSWCGQNPRELPPTILGCNPLGTKSTGPAM